MPNRGVSLLLRYAMQGFDICVTLTSHLKLLGCNQMSKRSLCSASPPFFRLFYSPSSALQPSASSSIHHNNYTRSS